MSRQSSHRGASRGYTLVEMAVVLAILGVLAVTAIPLSTMVQQRARETELRLALKDIRLALDRYAQASAEGAFTGTVGLPTYPASLEVLTQPLPDLRPTSSGKPLRLLRRLPRDPFADEALPAAKTWGLRSYLSEADKPAPGDDVYDVYSLSTRRALDGTQVKDW